MFPEVYRKWKKYSLRNRQDSSKLVRAFGAAGFRTLSVKPLKNTSLSDPFGFKITIGNETAFFPLKDSIEILQDKAGLTGFRETFMSVELVLPPFFTLGWLNKLEEKIRQELDFTKKYLLIDLALTEMYPLQTLAGYFYGKYSKPPTFWPYRKPVLEAIETFAFGFYRASVALLLPSIEGIIRNLGVKVGVNLVGNVSKDGLLTGLENIAEGLILDVNLREYTWTPRGFKWTSYFDTFDERVQVVESLRIYVENKLYAETETFSGNSALNRHGIFHGFLTDFDSPSNFYRLITVLNVLAFASVFVENVGDLWGVADNEEILGLSKHLNLLRLAGDARLKNLRNLGVE